MSHCAPPKPLAQAPHSCGGAQAVAACVLQAAASSSARRVPARPVSSEVNWPPAANAIDWPTLALSPASSDSADGIWPCDRPNRAGMAPRPGPALKAVSRARATEIWLPPRPGVAAIDDCRKSDTLLLP